MKLSVTIDRDEDGVWVVECPAIPGCVSQGKTKAQAIKNIEEAIALCLECRAESGLQLAHKVYEARNVAGETPSTAIGTIALPEPRNRLRNRMVAVGLLGIVI